MKFYILNRGVPSCSWRATVLESLASTPIKSTWTS